MTNVIARFTPFDWQRGWHEVIVSKSEHDTKAVEQWIADCLKGTWTLDWGHGGERSSSREERDQARYLFESIEDAALARTFWG